jgi:hypothetical protein
VHPAASTARYVISRVQHASGARWLQGKRTPPLDVRCDDDDFSLDVVAQQRLRGVCERAHAAIVHWANDERDVVLMVEAPTPRALISMQARGRRCVTLLGDVDADARDDAGLEFAVHDLCHLEKFVEPAHHRGQVGFFRAFDAAIATDAWRALDARLDDAWRKDFESVVADMNGSAVFLLAALQMRLRMASRRRLARERGVAPPTHGALDRDEARAYHDDLDLLCDALGWDTSLRACARVLSTRRDEPAAATTLLARFELQGAEVTIDSVTPAPPNAIVPASTLHPAPVEKSIETTPPA